MFKNGKKGDKIVTTTLIHGTELSGPAIGTKGTIISVSSGFGGEYSVRFEKHINALGNTRSKCTWFVYEEECNSKLKSIKQREFTDAEWEKTVGE